MGYLTLQEIFSQTGITRRAIQGYEKAGLVFSAGKNERGCLLYDMEAQERIRQIKLFQRLGFSIKEIQILMNLPRNKLEAVMKDSIERLRRKREETSLLIKEAEEFRKQLR